MLRSVWSLLYAAMGALSGVLICFNASAETFAPATNHYFSAKFWRNIEPFGEFNQHGNELHLISGGNWILVSRERYRDFVLEVELQMPDVKEFSNSGILFRGEITTNPMTGDAFAYGYQAEVDPSDRQWSGGLYEHNATRQWLHPVHPTRSFPDEHFVHNYSPEWTQEKATAYQHLHWNHYRIQAIGPDIKIWVNNRLTTHVFDTARAEGVIGLQHHGSHAFAESGDRHNTIKFRNLKIVELDLAKTHILSEVVQ